MSAILFTVLLQKFQCLGVEYIIIYAQCTRQAKYNIIFAFFVYSRINVFKQHHFSSTFASKIGPYEVNCNFGLSGRAIERLSFFDNRSNEALERLSKNINRPDGPSVRTDHSDGPFLPLVCTGHKFSSFSKTVHTMQDRTLKIQWSCSQLSKNAATNQHYQLAFLNHLLNQSNEYRYLKRTAVTANLTYTLI